MVSDVQDVVSTALGGEAVTPEARERLGREERAMMHGMTGDGGMAGMMWGMGLFGVLAVLVLLLAIAALVKYLFFR